MGNPVFLPGEDLVMRQGQLKDALLEVAAALDRFIAMAINQIGHGSAVQIAPQPGQQATRGKIQQQRVDIRILFHQLLTIV